MNTGYKLSYVSDRKYAEACMGDFKGVMFASKEKLREVGDLLRDFWFLGDCVIRTEGSTEYFFNNSDNFAKVIRGLTEVKRLPKRTPSFVKFVSGDIDDLEKLINTYGLAWDALQVKSESNPFVGIIKGGL